MSDTAKGAELYIYHGEYRNGLVDSEVGPGNAEIVYDEFEKGKWARKSSVGPMSFDEIRALAAAVDLMAKWEGDEPVPSQVVVKIEIKKGG